MRQSFARAVAALLFLNVTTILSCGSGSPGNEGDPSSSSTSTVTPGSPSAGTTASVGSSAPGAGATPPPATDPNTPPATPTMPTTPPGTTPPPATPPSTAGATLVPLYTPPGDPSWTTIVAAKQAHPTVRVLAVVNPANGPGQGLDAAYSAGISRLAGAGVEVLGYVATGYTARSEAAVDADIANWKAWYPQIHGIFFDEQSNRAGDEAHYQHLVQFAHDKGLPFTVGNPGQDTSESFVGVFDMMLIYENKGLPAVTALEGWHTKYAPSNFGVIPYGTSLDANYVRMARQHVGYVYLNNDTLPNPWDTLPPYFSDLLAALE